MKKTVLLGVLSLVIMGLTACGPDGGTDPIDTGTPVETPPEAPLIIKPSELISAEEAGSITGETMADDLLDSTENQGPATMRTVYLGDEYMFQIALAQDSMLDENAPEDQTYIANGGVAGAIERLTDARER
ncbi:MAG: hypothetical protein FWD55_05405, partial [Propionibacteriaceae bacterium]|nr:hypothetical protein [Propionibacteriaceae bacterium]